MNQFEYKIESFRAAPDNEDFKTFLERIGRDGWELCGVIQSKGDCNSYADGAYIFKRKLIEDNIETASESLKQTL